MRSLPSMTGVKDAALQLVSQLYQYNSQCSRADYVRALVVVAAVGYAVVTGSVVWAVVSYVMFALVCGPLRELWVDILENDDYPSDLTPSSFLGMVVIKLAYGLLIVLLELLDHFLGLGQLVKSLGLGQFMRALLGIRTQKGDSDAFTPLVKSNDLNGKKVTSDQGFVHDDHSAVLPGSSRDAFPSAGFDTPPANAANEKNTVKNSSPFVEEEVKYQGFESG